MGLVPRRAVLAIAAGALAAGCGSSVADRDGREPVRTAPPPPSPFCAAAQANSAAIRPLNTLLARGTGVPPEELSNTVDAVRRTSADLLNAAPNEIRPEVERTVQATNLQLDALLASGGDGGAVARDRELAARLNSPEFTGAAEQLRSYLQSNCDENLFGRR
ncbi:hypothetical protein [Pseudonocardia nigra]|uniref:hypothetical protein n=1 Tax=Pseudonocardia nigra TaxID=1921578 RepID=UPI001C5ECC97|nr:hypothetical protein [Pseudonocardia nigra]